VGVFDKKKSPREISKEISEGKREPEHLGKYTKEIIEQELYSLENTNPQFRSSKWIKRVESVKDAIMKKLSRNENSIICQIQLRKLEWIENQR